MTRKFYIGSYNNTHTIYEMVRGGARAVSPTYFSKEEAQQGLILLQTTNLPRIKRG